MNVRVVTEGVSTLSTDHKTVVTALRNRATTTLSVGTVDEERYSHRSRHLQICQPQGIYL